jgi:hypothetical protein
VLAPAIADAPDSRPTVGRSLNRRCPIAYTSQLVDGMPPNPHTVSSGRRRVAVAPDNPSPTPDAKRPKNRGSFRLRSADQRSSDERDRERRDVVPSWLDVPQDNPVIRTESR